MRQARDTFLRFLADNLSDFSIPVHNLRRDKDNPEDSAIQHNAVNVMFLNTNLSTEVSQTNVSVDVVNDDELTAIDWTEKVWAVLSGAFMTPMLNYTSPLSPVGTHSNVYWNRKAIRFRPITDQYVYRYNATFLLNYHF